MDHPQAQPKKATLRLGNRERARLQTVLVVIICVLLWVIVFRPWIAGMIENRKFQTCQTNAQKIARALTMYEDDWDGAFPPGGNWTNAVLGNMAATSNTGFDVRNYLKCPKDDTSAPSSYLYNDLMAGVNPNMAYPSDGEKEGRRRMVRNPSRFPLILEKHGSEANASERLDGWDEVIATMSFPHALPEPTGILITGAGSPVRRTRKQIEAQAGKNF